MPRWWSASKRLRVSLRLLSRLVVSHETQTACLMEINAHAARIADALETWNATLAERDDAQGLPGVEVPVPDLTQVLQRLSAQAPAVQVASPRSFRTGPPPAPLPTEEREDVGGVDYRDGPLLARAAQLELTLRRALGREPSEQELADALAIDEGREGREGRPS